MKRLICFLLSFVIMSMAVPALAVQNAEMTLSAVCENESIEVGDQFLVALSLGEEHLPFLTFSMVGTFDSAVAELIAPVYTNDRLGVLVNSFSNEMGAFKFEGYDQRIKGIDDNIVFYLLFEAKAEGEFKVDLSDECKLGKADENAFYELEIVDGSFTIGKDSDGEKTMLITDTEPLTPFDDMFGYDWAEKAVGVMYELGVLDSIADTSYRPGEMITRGDFITMLVRVCKLKMKGEVEPFNDVNEESYVYEPVMIAKSRGIAKGDENNNFNPDAPITRQDICALVFRTMLNMGKAKSEIVPENYLSRFTDSDKIAPYAVESVAGLIRAKLIIGDDTGLIRPTDNMTRAEAAVLLNRLAEYNILIS